MGWQQPLLTGVDSDEEAYINQTKKVKKIKKAKKK